MPVNDDLCCHCGCRLREHEKLAWDCYAVICGECLQKHHEAEKAANQPPSDPESNPTTPPER